MIKLMLFLITAILDIGIYITFGWLGILFYVAIIIAGLFGIRYI